MVNVKIFEVSWEVCNKVGGIHTVITSKANQMVKEYGEDYFVVGPFIVQKASSEFQEKLPPEFLREAFKLLRNEGIICHYGRWLIDGTPNTILIDFSEFTKNRNEIKRKLWDRFRIDSLNTEYFDFDEPVIWAYSVGRMIEEVKKRTNERIILHAHEWLSGAAILYIRMNNVKVATVFTTHATVLGRALASAGRNFYANINLIKPDEEAYKNNIQAKHQLEKQTALNCDVFTTVSEITSIEANVMLGRKADVILPNGLDISKFPTFDELAIKHKNLKNKIKEFLMYYFFPYYSFDIEKTLIYFIAGRYEFHDKGIDIFIKALSKLNKRLKDENSEKTVVAFFWIPASVKSIRPELLESRTLYEDLRDTINEEFPEIKQKILYLMICGKEINDKSLFTEPFLLEVKKKMLRLKRQGSPPLSTHEIYNEDNDLIMKHLKESGINNGKDDKVKVIYYPIYLTGADGLLDLNYYECMTGSHLGVFASFYEPWGYTPLEAAALGISSITTDLAGFGRYVLKHREDPKTPGIFVLKRFNVDDETAVENLANLLYEFTKLSKEERIKNKIEANRISKLADWNILIKNYFEAHKLALKIFLERNS